MSELVSHQTIELGIEFAGLLARLRALIDNRSSWQDGVEGCRATVELLTGATERLTAICDAAGKLEANLDAARAECKTWSANHADLCVVELQLRAKGDEQRVELKTAKAEIAALKKRNGELIGFERELHSTKAQIESLKARNEKFVSTNQELREANEQHRAELERLGTALASARSLAKQLEAVCK
jgi:chromosome segregation ATPase